MCIYSRHENILTRVKLWTKTISKFIVTFLSFYERRYSSVMNSFIYQMINNRLRSALWHYHSYCYFYGKLRTVYRVCFLAQVYVLTLIQEILCIVCQKLFGQIVAITAIHGRLEDAVAGVNAKSEFLRYKSVSKKKRALVPKP